MSQYSREIIASVILVLFFSSPGLQFANTQKQQQSRHSQEYEDVKREYLKIRRDFQRLEEEINRRRQQYYERTKEKFKDLGDNIADMIWGLFHGESPTKMPDPRDLVELFKDYGEYVGLTANDLIDLRTETVELELRLQKTNQRIVELKHADDLARKQRPTPRKPTAPLEPPLPVVKPTDPNELDDAINQWGYRELGDRYFDGRSEALERFLEKHPEYRQGVKPHLPPPDIKSTTVEGNKNQLDVAITVSQIQCPKTAQWLADTEKTYKDMISESEKIIRESQAALAERDHGEDWYRAHRTVLEFHTKQHLPELQEALDKYRLEAKEMCQREKTNR
jgi:hypothetical protein